MKYAEYTYPELIICKTSQHWRAAGCDVEENALCKPFSHQKQPFRGVLRKRCSKNIQQIYRRIPMPKCDFNKIEIARRHGSSPENLLHIFRAPLPNNTYRGLLLSHRVSIRKKHQYIGLRKWRIEQT